jgi:hypothetical protein
VSVGSKLNPKIDVLTVSVLVPLPLSTKLVIELGSINVESTKNVKLFTLFGGILYPTGGTAQLLPKIKEFDDT